MREMKIEEEQKVSLFNRMKVLSIRLSLSISILFFPLIDKTSFYSLLVQMYHHFYLFHKIKENFFGTFLQPKRYEMYFCFCSLQTFPFNFLLPPFSHCFYSSNSRPRQLSVSFFNMSSLPSTVV